MTEAVHSRGLKIAGGSLSGLALESWLREKLGLINQKTKLAEAIRYALPRWDGLTRFIDDGCAGPGARVPSGMDPANSCASGANLCFSEAVADAV